MIGSVCRFHRRRKGFQGRFVRCNSRGHNVIKAIFVHITLAFLAIRSNTMAHQLMGTGAADPLDAKGEGDVFHRAFMAVGREERNKTLHLFITHTGI